MSVYYTGGGGGLLGSLLGAAAMFVPGLQGVAPYLYGANALMKGDVGGAIGSIAGPAIGKGIGNAFDKTMQSPTSTPMNDSLWNAQRTQFQPPDSNTYVDWRLDAMRKPANDALDAAAYLPQSQQANAALDTAAYLPQRQANTSLRDALLASYQNSNRRNPWERGW
jgi:hypothetical protein